MSQLPASAVRPLRPQPSKNPSERTAAALGPVVAKPIAAATPAVVAVPATPPRKLEEPRELNIIGPRKLVRPTLPARALRDRRFQRREEPMSSWQAPQAATMAQQDSSHAEAFYFQKQMQTQTPMVFVLEDGERIEGCIEWYDRNAIKVRGSAQRRGEGGTRTMIYKSSIKYLYKAGENQPQS